jgi:hypothetical protein
METENWYLTHRSRVMWQTRFILRHSKKHLEAAYGKAEGEAILMESLQRFEALLPDIPYIGGAENKDTQSLCMAAAWLAMYRSLRARGASVEETARILYLGTESLVSSIPMRWLMRWQGRRLFSQRRIQKRRRAAALSQQRRYPDDWVFEIVDGDGQEFDFGVDYTECGIVKYFAREGAPELAPYGCWIDDPMSAAMGVRLDRTETIAQGGQRCDFRFSRREPVEVEPEFLRA